MMLLDRVFVKIARVRMEDCRATKAMMSARLSEIPNFSGRMSARIGGYGWLLIRPYITERTRFRVKQWFRLYLIKNG